MTMDLITPSKKVLANRKWAEKRRQKVAAAGVCINGDKHGPATDGCRCAWCGAVHRKGVRAVLADPNAPARPPGYRLPRNYNEYGEVISVPEVASSDVSQSG